MKKFTFLLSSLLLAGGLAWANSSNWSPSEVQLANEEVAEATAEETSDYAPTTRTAAPEAGKVYMFFNATKQSGERWGFVKNNGGSLQTVKDLPANFTTTDLAYLWTIEPTDKENMYTIRSLATGLYADGTGACTSATPIEVYIHEYTTSPRNNGQGEFVQEADNSAFTAYADLTPADKLWTISNTIEASTTNDCWNGNPGSFACWNDAHAFAIYESTNMEKAINMAEVALSAEYAELTNTINTKTPEWLAKAQAECGVTDASKYSSNAPEPSEGSLAFLIDGDTSKQSFFHSAWSTGVPGPHTLQIDRGENTGDFYIYTYKRTGDPGSTADNGNRPTNITVSGSTNGTDFSDITVLENIPMSIPYYFSDAINGGENTHIRFTVNETNSGTEFFTYSEFYLLSATEGSFAQKLHDALVAFNNIQTMEDVATVTNMVAALREPTTVTADPIPGEVEAMPSEVTLTFSRDIMSVDYVKLKTGGPGEPLTDLFEYSSFHGNVMTIPLPAEALEGINNATLILQVKDADNVLVTYGAEDAIVLNYTVKVTAPANTFNAVRITPAEGEVTSLKQFDIFFDNTDGDFVGYYDLTKTVELKDAEGQVVAKGSVDYHELWYAITITLDQEVTAAGTYTLTVPEGTVYNSLCDPYAEDWGLSMGATYNPELVYTYTIAESGDAELPLGAVVTNLEDIDPYKAYVLYNPNFTAYAIYKPVYNEDKLWLAEAIGTDNDHQVSDPTFSEPLDKMDAGSSWQLMKNAEGQYFLYNVGAKRYMTTGRPCTFVSEATPVHITELGDGKFAFSTTAGQNDYMCASPQQAAEPIAVWNSTDQGSCWQFMENPNVEADKETADIVTAIQQAIISGGDASVYTLSGVKLGIVDPKTLPAGLYIVNGKKVLVK